MRFKPLAVSVAAMAVLAIGLTGCDATSGEGEGEDAVVAQLYQQATGFNVLAPTGGADESISQLQFRSLAHMAPGGVIEGDLATSWEVAADGMSVEFTLPDGLQWSDGEALDADDVVFTYNTYANPATGTYYSGNFSNVVGAAEFAAGEADSVAGFLAPDAQTFRVEFIAPEAEAVSLLTASFGGWVLPEHRLADIAPEALGTDPFFREPDVGSGPYVFSKWVNDDLTEFLPNPNYPDGLALDRVFAQHLTSDAAIAAIRSGDADIIQVQASDVGGVEGLEGIELQRGDPTSFRAFYTAFQNGKLDDVLVRQAIMYAIDRQGIVDNVLGGEGIVLDTPALYPPDAVPSDLNDYAYDPEMAKQLLAEAGWDPATVVRLEVVPGDRDRDTVLTIVAEQLNAVGIKAEVTPLEAAKLGEVVGASDFDMLLSGGTIPSDPSFFRNTLSCAQVDAGGNISGYCNPEFDAIMLEATETVDPAERAALYQQAQTIYNTDVPTLPMYATASLWATGDHIEGFEASSGVFYSAATWSIKK